MKKLLAVLMLIGSVALAVTQQQEVLVLTTSTKINRRAGSPGFEIQNQGPNSIFCNIGAAAVLNKSREIAPDGFWGAGVPAPTPVYCIAATANQVTGAATIFSEAK